MLDFAEHVLIGDWIKRELEKVDIVLGDLIVAYGDDAPEIEYMERLRRTFRQLRDNLDTKVSEEYINENTASIYYGRPD